MTILIQGASHVHSIGKGAQSSGSSEYPRTLDHASGVSSDTSRHPRGLKRTFSPIR